MDGCETDVQDIGREISVIRLHLKVSSDFAPSRPTREQRLRLFGADWRRPLVPIAWKEERKKKKSRDILHHTIAPGSHSHYYTDQLY